MTRRYRNKESPVGKEKKKTKKKWRFEIRFLRKMVNKTREIRPLVETIQEATTVKRLLGWLRPIIRMQEERRRRKYMRYKRKRKTKTDMGS